MALGDTDRAGQAYDKVLSVAPHNVAALDGLALMLGARGQERERVALMERALAVDPRNVSAIWRLCQDHFWYRHFDQALAYQRRLLEIRPDDVSLRAEYHRIEYCRTGSWTSYDEWRRSLPRAAEFTHEDVREMDVKRAAARRDYAEVLRLANIIPDEGRGRANLLQIELLNQCWQAYAHRAAGNRTLALESARAGTRLAETQIARSPRDWIARYMLATLQAVLGERDSVWETHAGAVAVAQQEDNAHQADRARRHDFYLHAILGDRAEALSGAACQLESPGWQAHEFRVSLELADLWDDPQFQTLVDDPKNNGPLPIRNRNLSRAKDC
jgi:tetratricopeptide (TPR) repeat protein